MLTENVRYKDVQQEPLEHTAVNRLWLLGISICNVYELAFGFRKLVFMPVAVSSGMRLDVGSLCCATVV